MKELREIYYSIQMSRFPVLEEEKTLLSGENSADKISEKIGLIG